MKKNLFIVLLCFGLLQMTQAQVIDVVGLGVLGTNEATLVIPDPGTVDQVVVEAAAIFRSALGAPAAVNFKDDNESFDVDFTPVEIEKGTNANSSYWEFGYYTATFVDLDADGEIVLDKNGQGDAILTFYAYVYRTDGSVNMYSMTAVNEERAFIYENGSTDPLVYEFELTEISGMRNISVTVPFSDNELETVRYAVVKLSAVGFQESLTFILSESGSNFVPETLVLNDVPGNVTTITVTVYSPKPGLDPQNGDSFIVGLPILTVEEEVEEGCTLTQGYWKTHSIYGPAAHPDDTWDLILGGPDATFFLSGKTYLEVLNTPVKGNAYYILAHQYIAAELNFLAGADDSEVTDEFDQATGLLEDYTPAQIGALKGNNPVRALFTSLGGILDDFNNGIIGPGHCGEEYEITEKSAVLNNNSLVFREFTVYPNPVKGVATLSFNPNFDGNTTIDLYSATGQKTVTLFNQNVRKDVPVNFTFNSHQFTQGLYIIRVQNGSSVENLKIQIGK